MRYWVGYIFLILNIVYNIAQSQHSIPDYESNPSNLNYSAFCRSSSYYEDRYYPTDLPEHHLRWIWEAVYDPVKEYVDLTTFNRVPCRLEKRKWTELQRLFPDQLHNLAYGLESNILVPSPEDISIEEEYFLHDKTVYCEFMYQGKLVHSVESHRIRGKKPYTSFSSLQIRCPAPRALQHTWDRIRYRLHPDRRVYTSNIFGNVTHAVPVCRLPSYDVNKKKYGLSICTATGRAHRDHLVEWLEYHILAGVEHVYIYDTALENRTALSATLQDYINDGYVTVIPWHFMNCVRHMGNGRWVMWVNFKTMTPLYFKIPRAIAQSGALASCYTRFRHTSKYIAHIDDDEFLTFSPFHIQNEYQLHDEPKTLLAVVDAAFHKQPRAVALRFEPVQFWPCHVQQGIEYVPYNTFQYPAGLYNGPNITSTPLPRLGTWDVSEPIPDKFECKLIMNTEAVGMFFVHFVSLVEVGSWHRARLDNSVTLPISHLSMLHYKYPPYLSNSFEGELPITPSLLGRSCEYMRRKAYTNKHYFAQIPSFIGPLVKENFVKRKSRIEVQT